MKDYSNKIVTILMIIILLGIIIGYNIFGLGTIVKEIIGSIKSNISEVKERTSITECPSYIIPSKISLMEYPEKEFIGSWENGISIQEYKSPDDNSIDISLSSIFDKHCRQGKQEGENINYIYCNDLYYTKDIQEIDSSGSILAEDSDNYKIALILEPEIGDYIIYRRSFPLTDDMFTQEELYEGPSVDLILRVAQRNNLFILDNIDWNERLKSYAQTNITTKFDDLTWQYRNPFEGLSWVLLNGNIWLSDCDSLFERCIYKNYTVLNANCIKV